MRLHLNDFKEGESTHVEGRYDPKTLDLEFVDMRYCKPLELEGTVEKGRDSLSFRGHLVSAVEYTCGRCLKRVQKTLDRSFELFYEIKGREAIETLDDLREVLILDHPIRFLCQENCRGLCPQCGINWNDAICDCQQKTKSSPLSSMKDYWRPKQKER